jgi:hypothetical protein
MNNHSRLRTAGPIGFGVVAVVAVLGASMAAVSVLDRSQDDGLMATPGQASADLHSRADSVFERFNGTQAQRNAAGLLQAWALNGAMDQCMESAGFPDWDWSAAHHAAPRTNALEPSLFFAPPMNHSYSNSLRDSTTFLAAEETLRTETLSKHETDVVVECANSTPSVSDDAASDASTPPLATKLRDQWWDMLESWQTRYGDVDDYNECFAKAAEGLPVDTTRGDSWKGDLSSFVPPAGEIPPANEGDVAAGDAWQGFLELEAALETADWSCRQGTYETHLGDITDDINAFAAEHSSEISDAASAWGDVESRAAQLTAP